MKRAVALLLTVTALFAGCSQVAYVANKDAYAQNDCLSDAETKDLSFSSGNDNPKETVFPGDIKPEFASLNDPALLQYVEDKLYSDLTAEFGSEDYIIEDISSIYVSEEYLEEAEYNSKKNIYFGHTLEEIDAQFQGTRYVFSLSDSGETVAEEFAEYDDIYTKVVENVSFGVGVILVCVTVSVVTGGPGVPCAVSMIFNAAAKTGTKFALSSGVIGSVAAGIVTGIKTGELEKSINAAALAGSEDFKWGAISGVIAGGVKEMITLHRGALTIPTYRESELEVLRRTEGGREQVPFLDGIEVPYNTRGATRPDVIVPKAGGAVRAIEVKNYSLTDSASRAEMLNELERQISNRKIHLPKGSTQEIVLDVRGRHYGQDFIKSVITEIKDRLSSVYPNIPVFAMTG